MSQGFNYQPKSIHGGFNGFRRQPYLTSMEGESLGLLKHCCPSEGKCFSSEAGVPERVEEQPHHGKERKDLKGNLQSRKKEGG